MDRTIRVYHGEAVWDLVFDGIGGHPETQQRVYYAVYRDGRPRSGPPSFRLAYWPPNAENPLPLWGLGDRETILYPRLTDAIDAYRWPADHLRY